MGEGKLASEREREREREREKERGMYNEKWKKGKKAYEGEIGKEK